jgi:methionyl-tRNA formyltransferase
MDFGRGGERVKILRALLVVEGAGTPGEVIDERLTVACRRGALRILEAQRAGKAAMSGEALARGGPIERGARFT